MKALVKMGSKWGPFVELIKDKGRESSSSSDILTSETTVHEEEHSHNSSEEEDLYEYHDHINMFLIFPLIDVFGNGVTEIELMKERFAICQGLEKMFALPWLFQMPHQSFWKRSIGRSNVFRERPFHKQPGCGKCWANLCLSPFGNVPSAMDIVKAQGRSDW
ncbi:hypothetical protein V6N13_080517 [Hibiscus sabdariffa]